MQIFLTILTIASLTYAAGLNASMTLALVAVLAREHQIDLAWPLDHLTDRILFSVLIPLTIVEIWISKIPAAARVNDYVQLVWRGAVAGVLAIAVSGNREYFIVVAFGPFIAAMVLQIIRIAARLVVSTVTHGVGVPLMSMLEDLTAAVTAIIAIIAPAVSLAFVVASGYLLLKMYRRIRERHLVRQLNAMLPPIDTPMEPFPGDPEPPKELT